MRDKGFALLFMLAESILQHIWNSLWEVAFNAIEYAEEQWEEQSEKKKEYVEERVMEYVKEHADLNFVSRKAVEIFLSRMIDSIVEQIENELGDNWVDAIDEYEDRLAEIVPVIE